MSMLVTTTSEAKNAQIVSRQAEVVEEGKKKFGKPTEDIPT